MKKLILLFSLLLPFISIADDDDDDCDFSLELSNATIEPSETLQVIQQDFTVRRESSSNGNCSRYRLFFGKGFANSYQRRAFSWYLQSYTYNLHQNINMSGVLKDFNDALNTTEYIQGNTPQRRTDYNNRFYISVPAISSQSNPRAGVYRDFVELSLYRLTNSNRLYHELSRYFQVTINISYRIDISLVNEGDPFNKNSTSKVMDFGNLEVNQELGADIVVDSNTSYAIRMSSLNNGQLKNGSSSVTYSLRVGSNSVNLTNSSTNPVTVATGNGPTSEAGDRYNVKVRITNIPSNPDPGMYQDSITITAIAN